MSELTLPLLTRIWFALVCWLRILFDGAFAARVWAVRSGLPALAPPAKARDDGDGRAKKEPAAARAAARAKRAKAARPERDDAATVAPLQLLALLQREGRLIDFLQQDIAEFDDAEVGTAARVVHEGCRRALGEHATIEPIRTEAEESPVRIEAGFDPAAIKLTGEVTGEAPYSGVLRHGGWRVRDLRLPEPLAGHDFTVVAPAEVEL